MSLLTKVLESKNDQEVDVIIKEELDKIQNSVQPVEQLGFLPSGQNICCHKGFIPFNTRIKYAQSNMETYGMETTDFFYDFAHSLRKYKINKKSSFVYFTEYFINQYFGFAGKNNRETIFDDIAWNSTTTDEEYFAALQNNKIGDLKGKGAALCTERGALAQQLLSFFGIETYYCMGCVDLVYKQEGHCFNVIRRQNDYALLDYSLPVGFYNDNGSLIAYYPFVGVLSEEEFLNFINNGVLKSFDDYQIVNGNKQLIDSSRSYIVGSFSIDKEKTK